MHLVAEVQLPSLGGQVEIIVSLNETQTEWPGDPPRVLRSYVLELHHYEVVSLALLPVVDVM